MTTCFRRHLWLAVSRPWAIKEEGSSYSVLRFCSRGEFRVRYLHQNHRQLSQHPASEDQSGPKKHYTTDQSGPKTQGTTDQSGPKTQGTTDFAEVNKFSVISGDWWVRGGSFQALHNLNELRVPLIRDATLQQSNGVNLDSSKTRRPLTGYRIIDVGCGGGILSEPLARLGADVTGLDASEENIEVAREHAAQDPSVPDSLSYVYSSVEDLVTSENSEGFDTLVASEILEHVANPEQFVEACCKLVKPNGALIFTTLNKTFLSYALGVVAAENIARIVPQGAHDWNKFIPPSHLQDMLSQNGCHTMVLHGMMLNPVTLRWSWCQNTTINYALHAVKLS